MKYKVTSVLCLVALLTHLEIFMANDSKRASKSSQLPPIETFLLESIGLESVSIWIPAATTGPLINRSCRPKKNCLYSCILPASVNHTKTERCPKELAVLLAEYTACYHEQSLPLTIFNGWQWEYSYSLCQYETVKYDLPERGGCWENSWEAILTQSTGSVDFQWFQLSPSNEFVGKSSSSKPKSSIEVRTFDSMRTRDGYPKKRQL